jgi:hypothetical protein
MKRRLLPVLALALLAASCDRFGGPKPDKAAAPAAQQAYRHALSGDVSGEYRPLQPIQLGDAELESIFVGQVSALKAWEEGKGGASPVTVTFKTAQGAVRVGPESYQITDDVFRFSGQTVAFVGKLDQGDLATARRNLGDQTAVLTGTLTVGKTGIPVRLGLWGGD